jgi:hypothetical protein
VIFVEVEACSGLGSVVSVLSDDEVDGAEADTLLTTEETIERSTGYKDQPQRQHVVRLAIRTFVWQRS